MINTTNLSRADRFEGTILADNYTDMLIRILRSASGMPGNCILNTGVTTYTFWIIPS